MATNKYKREKHKEKKKNIAKEIEKIKKKLIQKRIKNCIKQINNSEISNTTEFYRKYNYNKATSIKSQLTKIEKTIGANTKIIQN